MSLSSNTDRLLEGQPLVVTAMVSDPDGVDDIQGGNLSDDNGNVLGTFLAAGPGTYSLTLPWNVIPQALTAQGETPIQLTLHAQFVDLAQHEGTRALPIVLDCTNDAAEFCGGSCTQTQTDPLHCGECNNGIPVGTVCVEGAPECTNPGLPIVCEAGCVASSTQNCGSCGNDCAAYVPIEEEGATCFHKSYLGEGKADFCAYEYFGGSVPASGQGLCPAGTSCTALRAFYMNGVGTTAPYGFPCDSSPPESHMGATFVSFNVLCSP